MAAVAGLPSLDSDKSEAKVTAGGSAIYGLLTYSDDYDISDGLYELTKSGAIMKWVQPNKKYDFNSGWLKDGKICGYAEDKYGYQMRGMIYEEIDFETGAALVTETIDITTSAYFTCATLNPTDNVIYGYGKDENGKFAFLKADAATPLQITAVKNVDSDDTFISTCFNPVDGKIYGITKDYYHKLVTVDAAGTQSVVMSLNGTSDVCEDYITGLVYSPVEELFYWNKYEGEESYKSSLVTINPVAKTVTSVRNYSSEEQFSVYVTTDKYVVAGQPAAPVIDNVSFVDGSLSGKISFTMPSEDVDGAAITSAMTWTVYVDDKEIKNGTANAGASVNVDITGQTEGMHTYSVAATTGTLTSEKAFRNVYVGFDTPKAPQNVTLTEGGISWDAVTEGVNGGYVDIADLKYEVKIGDESKGTTASNSMTGVIPANQPLAWYQGSVVATCHGKNSVAAESNKCLAGTPLALPVSLVPTAEEFTLMQRFDLDGDSYSWKCRDGYMESQWTLSKDGGNDWVVLAPIAFPDASAVYSMSFEALRNMAETGRETLEVRIGKTANPEEMEQVIFPTFEPLTEYAKYNEIFHVAEAGTYYIAFHATSMKWEAGIENGQRVRNILIEKSNINNASPAAVTDLKAVAGEKGALNATLTFKMPDKTYDGNTLTASSVTATVVAEETKTVTGAPGSEQSVTVATRQGQNLITVSTSVGETAGTPTQVEIYTGVVIPGLASNLVFDIAEDMLSVDMKWDAATEGVTPGYVDPATVTYKIYEGVQNFYDFTWELRGTTQPGETHFTYSVEAGDQKCHTLVVLAENIAGHGDNMIGGDVLLGNPFAIPMLDDFDKGYGQFQYGSWIKYQPDDETTGYWSVWPLENIVAGADEDSGYALVGKPTEANSKGLIGVPAFTAKDGVGNVVIEFETLINDNTPQTYFTALRYGITEEVEVGRLQGTAADGLQTVRIVLPSEFSESPWIQLFINTVYTKSTELLVIDNFKIEKKEGVGVENIDSTKCNISAVDGGVRITGANGENMTVSTMNGIVMSHKAVSSADEIVTLEAGIYVVRVGKNVAVIRVK